MARHRPSMDLPAPDMHPYRRGGRRCEQVNSEDPKWPRNHSGTLGDPRQDPASTEPHGTLRKATTFLIRKPLLGLPSPPGDFSTGLAFLKMLPVAPVSQSPSVAGDGCPVPPRPRFSTRCWDVTAGSPARAATLCRGTLGFVKVMGSMLLMPGRKAENHPRADPRRHPRREENQGWRVQTSPTGP